MRANIGMGRNQNDWRFNGPYDYPTQSDDPKYFQLEVAYAKAGEKAFQKGIRKISLWKNAKNKARGNHFLYNHSKNKWKKLSRDERIKWIRKMAKMEKRGGAKTYVGENSGINLSMVAGQPELDWRQLSQQSVLENEQANKMRRATERGTTAQM